jgi:hypothetical protein
MKKLLFILCCISILSSSYGQTTAYDTISINNISARINDNGNLFWNLSNASEFKVPKGGKAGTIFNSTLWVGGLDSSGALHLAAEEYRESGDDYWPGPISTVYDSAYDLKWNNVWKITKTEIDTFLANWWLPGYTPSQAISNWPGNGDTTLGQAKIIAPFYDRNHDGIYNPHDGDYPLIKGDEAILFVINDARSAHTESGGTKLGLDIVAMAYAFDCPSDSALWNTLFLNYKIYNHSVNTYHNTYIGNFTDLDIGFANDDYIGCDVQRSSYYGYNGVNVDGSGQIGSYGVCPPAQSVTFLAGPYLDPADIINNPPGQCNASVSGFDFGSGINDRERFGLTKFIYYSNADQGGPVACTDPVVAIDYYHYLNDIWKDGTPMMWGGNAHTGGPGVCGPDCTFMFPGNSDSLYWSDSCRTPNCTPIWTERNVGNMPGDRRGLGVSGPFTFFPDSVEQLDLAFVFARTFSDSTDTAAIPIMQQRIDSVRKYFMNDNTPCGGSFSYISPHEQIIPQFLIYPNPTANKLTIECPKQATIEILNMQGQLIRVVTARSYNETIDVSTLSNGVYIVEVKTEKRMEVRKFIKE